jgi:hypothetical protein
MCNFLEKIAQNLPLNDSCIFGIDSYIFGQFVLLRIFCEIKVYCTCKCPFSELYRKLLRMGGIAAISWHSGGVVFTQPNLTYVLKIKAIWNL